MSDYQRLSLEIQVSRDANHAVAAIPPVTLEFDSEPDYWRMTEIRMVQGPSSVATIDETEFAGTTGRIEDLVIVHKTPSSVDGGLRVQFTNVDGTATNDIIPPGQWNKYSGCNSDVTLTNTDSEIGIEVLYFCSGEL